MSMPEASRRPRSAGPLERLPEEWAELLSRSGEPRYRALQVFRWIHQRGVLDPEQMSDLPKALREQLARRGAAARRSRWRECTLSEDSTRKLLLALARRARQIETRADPAAARPRPTWSYDSTRRRGRRRSAASAGRARAVHAVHRTQVGCAMGCVFCASGIAGLKRNLSAGEIVAQVLVGRRAARAATSGCATWC